MQAEAGADPSPLLQRSYQRRSGKCQLIFLLVLLIFACIIIILYKPRSHSSDPSPSPPPATGDTAILADGVLDGRAFELEPRRLRVGLAGAVHARDGSAKEGRKAKRFLGAGRGPSLPVLVERRVGVEERRRRRWARWSEEEEGGRGEWPFREP